MPLAMRTACLALLAATVAAQHGWHHRDPFAGSGCNCSAFCKDECSINATAAATITQYRMTQFGVVDMTNKNTGDVPGDTSFVISRRTSAYECKKDPTNFMCSGIAQFSGDDPDSTDLVLEWQLEVDGKWGPYLMCNPVDAKKSTGKWACLDSIGGMGALPKPPPAYPATCSAAHFKGAQDYCVQGFNRPPWPAPAPAADLAACCASAHTASAMAYTFESNGTCSLYEYAFRGLACKGSVSGVKPPPPPPPPGTPGAACRCKRVNQTVGREDLVASGMGSMSPAGGDWFSYGAMGECKAGAALGTDGCTWHAKAIAKAINATCLYGHIDANIEAANPTCFGACAHDPTRMSDCYLKCYDTTVKTVLSHSQLSAPWAVAFKETDPAKGGCAVVKRICEHDSKRTGCPPAARQYQARFL